MGNTTGEEYYTTGEDGSVFPLEMFDSQLKRYRNAEGKMFVGREIQLPYGDGRENLMFSLQRKRDNFKYFVLPIVKCVSQKKAIFCSEQEKILVLCQQPETNLQNLFQARRKSKQTFNLKQILSIIERISKALQRLDDISQNIAFVDMSGIVFKDFDSFLLDPIMKGEELIVRNHKFGKYSSPEQLQKKYYSNGTYDDLSSNLFSLGLISLHLCFPQFNIEQIYTISNAGKKGINGQTLQKLLNMITHTELREKLTVLTHKNPQERVKIFKLEVKSMTPLYQSQINHQREKPIAAKDLSRSSIVGQARPVSNISHQEHQKTPNVIFSPYYPEKVLQNIPRPENRAPERVLQNSKKQPSINIVIQNSQKQFEKLPSITIKPPVNDKQSQQKNARFNKQNIKQNGNTIASMTPKKPKVKHDFSTIKEVTECDEEYSEQKMLSSFKAQVQAKYEGSMVNGMRQGFGKCFFPQGSRYEGEWKNDQMHGFGKLYYSNGTLAYEGQWLNNEFHGMGKVFCLDPTHLTEPFDFNDFNSLEQEWISYEGGLSNDKKQGWGVLILSNGQRFEGEFNNDMIEGRGTYYQKNGRIRNGIWKQGRIIQSNS